MASRAVGQTLNADQAKRLAGLPADQRNAIRDDMNKQLAKSVLRQFPAISMRHDWCGL